jgi:hypothetical protein
MVWLNDNALFGGQVETIVMATLVGILGRSRAERQRPDRLLEAPNRHRWAPIATRPRRAAA